MAARLTPDQKVGSSNLSGLNFHWQLPMATALETNQGRLNDKLHHRIGPYTF